MKNIDPQQRFNKTNDCESFFSKEIMLMTLRACDLLNKKITQMFAKKKGTITKEEIKLKES